MKFKLFLIVLIVFSTNLISQVEDSTFINEPQKKDSLTFKFKYKVGDRLKYSVVAFDSIMIDSDKPLTKLRKQEIELNVDSVLKNGNFIINYKMISFDTDEGYQEEAAKRNTHPMLNQEIIFEMDSLGKRIFTKFVNSQNAIIGPGGAFEPNLIFNLEQSQKAINESWIVESVDTLYENSNPASTIDQMTLFRLKGIIDTLDDKAIRIDLMRSSKGKFRFIQADELYYIQNSINQWGLFDISMTRGIPLHYHSTCEQKLKIKVGKDNSYKEGRHFISIFYTLIDIQNIPKNTKQIKKHILPKKKKKLK